MDCTAWQEVFHDRIKKVCLTRTAKRRNDCAMTFQQWLYRCGMNDSAAAELLDRNRAHISKLRRGKANPSYDLMVAVRDASGGKVSLDSWAPKQKARA